MGHVLLARADMTNLLIFLVIDVSDSDRVYKANNWLNGSTVDGGSWNVNHVQFILNDFWEKKDIK